MKAKASASHRPAVSQPNQIRATFGMAKFALRAALRNRSNFFFTLFFPLILIAVFGLFSNGGSPATIGVSDQIRANDPFVQAVNATAKEDKSPIKVVTGSSADLEAKLAKGDVSAVLEPGSDPARPDALSLATSSSDPTGAGTAETVLNAIAGELNLKAAGITTPPFDFTTREISGRTFSYIDFILPGQVGFSLLSLATFGVAFSFITLRKTLVLKRIFATSVSPLSFVVSQAISRAVQSIFQVAILVGVGVKFFHFHLAHGWVSAADMMVLAFLGVWAFLGFGLLVANIARDEQSAPIALNLFNFPQMFLAGTFFPTDLLPHWLQIVGTNLPLGYMNTAMRDIATNGDSLLSTWHQLLGLLVWSVIAYFLAARTFKSE